MAKVFLGNLVMPSRSRKMLSSGRELNDKNYSSVLVEVKPLSGKIDEDSRGSFGLVQCDETG